MKRLLSFLLTVAMLICQISVVSTSTSTVVEIPVGGEGAFVVDENGVLTAYNGAGGDITIPERVTSIAASAFAGCTTITSVVIPDTVTSIGSSAFKGCTNLESIRLSNAITAIPTDAFRNCVRLTSIFVPDGVKSIAGGAFRTCSSLVDIYLPDSVASIGIGAFYNCAYFLDLNNALDGVLYINNHVIKGDSTLTDYVIKDGVVTIAAEAFINLTNINELTIPDSVKNVGSNAFKGCTNITIRCNYGSYIASYAESKGINYRYLGDYVVVDNTLIQYNGKSTDAVIPEGVTAIADNAFTGCTITSVEIPATVTTIGDLAFDGCADFEIICEYNSAAETYAKNKGISYSYVSDFVVDGNGTLTKYVGKGGEIVIPNGVVTIGDNVFYGNSDITGVVIPESVKTIGKYAFYNCTNLTEVSIPEGITVIPEYSFAGCSSLESVKIPSTVTSISSSTFNKCYALADINIADGNSVYSSVDGVLFSADGKTLIQYPAGKTAAVYAVPENVTSINQYAFSNNAYLTKVTIPDTVTEMGMGILLSCTALEEANIPVGITVLPSNTFRDCTSLKSVVIPGNITAINSNAFYNCSALEWVAIPETVTSVAVLAFDKCTSLKDVYYGGSADAWTSVSIASSNNYLKNATFHYNVTDVENHFVYTVTLEPTCTEDGAAAYVCSCGYSKNEEKIPANGHAIVNHDGKAATCTENGWEAYETCENCDYTTYVELPAPGHNLVGFTAKAPTCNEIGWEAYEVCKNCDYTTYVEIPANGHAIVNHEAKAPTCTEIGWEAFETCENCDYTTYVEITANGHTYVSHDAQAPTCTEIGWEAYETCENCDYTTYVEIAAKGHAIVNHDGKDATCTESGWNAYETCENCDYTTYVEIPANGHSWDDGIITTEPNGDIPGVMTYTCTSCGETREESIQGHTHTYVTVETATCTEDGYRKTYCSVCGDVQSEEPIPAKGHSPANDLSCIYVELATCTKGGSITKLCPDCGEVTSYEETAPLNHMLDAVTDAFGEKYIGLYPTVEVEGYYAKKCKLCGFETVCEPIEKLHDADFMVIDGVLIDYLGQGGIAKIPGNVTTIGEGAFAGKNGITSVVVPANVTSIESGAFSGMNTTVIFLGNATEWGSVAKADGWDTDSTIKMVYGEIKFFGASITLENDLKVNYKIDKKYFEQYGFENPYVVFSIGDETVTVTDYTVVGSSYIFSYCDISPKMMNDVIKAKLYTSYDGNEYTATKNDYSIASYCYSLLSVYSSDANAELRTLLVDMLNYGAASQIYAEYNTNNLANARLTAKQKTWATSTTRDYVSVLDTKYEVIDNATVTWKSAGLVLGDSVIMRYKFAASDISDLTVKIEADGNEWFISSDEFEATTNGYYVYFDKFIATQMSETVLVTVYDGDTAVSNTLSYSIESYVDSMQDYENENFQDLMEMMMKYGDSAYAYAN